VPAAAVLTHTLLLTLLAGSWSHRKQHNADSPALDSAVRLLQVCHGWGQVQYPYAVSEDDPTPLREWVPIACIQQDEAALLKQGVQPSSIRGYVEPQEDLLKAPWERSMVIRPRCTNPNLRMRVSKVVSHQGSCAVEPTGRHGHRGFTCTQLAQQHTPAMSKATITASTVRMQL
jgi:hypothetical protein